MQLEVNISSFNDRSHFICFCKKLLWICCWTVNGYLISPMSIWGNSQSNRNGYQGKNFENMLTGRGTFCLPLQIKLLVLCVGSIKYNKILCFLGSDRNYILMSHPLKNSMPRLTEIILTALARTSQVGDLSVRTIEMLPGNTKRKGLLTNHLMTFS